MSEVNETAANAAGLEGANASPVNQSQASDNSGTTDTGANAAGLDALRATNQRLLEQSKEWKAKAQALNEKISSFEEQRAKDAQTKAEEQGRFKDLYQAEKSARAEEKNSLESKVQKYQQQILESKFSAAAAKAGCIDPGVAMHAGNQELLQWDPETLELHGMDAYFEDLKKVKGYLFNAQPGPTVNPAVPGGKPLEKKALTNAELARLPVQERIKYQLREAGLKK